MMVIYDMILYCRLKNVKKWRLKHKIKHKSTFFSLYMVNSIMYVNCFTFDLLMLRNTIIIMSMYAVH